MKRHWSYLKYLIRHKWYVFVAGRRLNVGFCRLVVHDWHKFLPSEWIPYASTFYNPDGTKAKYAESPEFADAWRKHQKRGSHHWQHWLLVWDSGKVDPLPMPEICIREMVADWYGAGRAITGAWGAPEWYEKNKERMRFDVLTRAQVEHLLKESAYAFIE